MVADTYELEIARIEILIIDLDFLRNYSDQMLSFKFQASSRFLGRFT